MALQTLSSSENFNVVIYDTISATPFPGYAYPEASLFLENKVKPQQQQQPEDNCEPVTAKGQCGEAGRRQNYGLQGRNKKRKRKARICKSKQQAETQRMTHIAVERNRRRQMNEHLAVLRSLMPDSYVQRGDQASIVGGAIEFVKELEHFLQSLEAQKLKILQAAGITQTIQETGIISKFMGPPLPQFFWYPQSKCSQPHNNKHTSKAKDALADIEVTLIETHANLRILLRRRSLRQLSSLVAGFERLYLAILHLNVSTIDSISVLYSVSAKVEEGCQLGSADDIATAVHRLLRGIEEEASLCC